MRVLRVKIDKNELTKPITTVAPWEVPMLEAIHNGGITVVGELDIDREYPSAEAEYERLDRKYRMFRDEAGDPTGESVVVAVYGRHRVGIHELGQAIAHARAADTAREKPAPRKRAAKPSDDGGQGGEGDQSEAA